MDISIIDTLDKEERTRLSETLRTELTNIPLSTKNECMKRLEEILNLRPRVREFPRLGNYIQVRTELHTKLYKSQRGKDKDIKEAKRIAKGILKGKEKFDEYLKFAKNFPHKFLSVINPAIVIKVFIMAYETLDMYDEAIELGLFYIKNKLNNLEDPFQIFYDNDIMTSTKNASLSELIWIKNNDCKYIEYSAISIFKKSAHYKDQAMWLSDKSYYGTKIITADKYIRAKTEKYILGGYKTQEKSTKKLLNKEEKFELLYEFIRDNKRLPHSRSEQKMNRHFKSCVVAKGEASYSIENRNKLLELCKELEIEYDEKRWKYNPPYKSPFSRLGRYSVAIDLTLYTETHNQLPDKETPLGKRVLETVGNNKEFKIKTYEQLCNHLVKNYLREVE